MKNSKYNIALLEIGRWFAGKLASHSQLEPLAIEYLAGYMEKSGYNVNLIQQRHENLDELIEKIKTIEPNIVGVSCYTYTFPDALYIAKRIKEVNPEIKTVLGGYHATARPTDIKYGDFDFFVIGEGEETLLELVQALENTEKDFSRIKGIVWRNGKELIVNPRRERMEFVKLPWPKRSEHFFGEAHVKGIIGKHRSVQVSYSRGCPNACKYCCSPLLWERIVKYRSAEDVVEEMRYLKREFNASYFYFTDLTFNANKEKVLELTNLLKKEKFVWGIMPSIDVGNMDESLIKEITEAGCKRLMFGIETLSKRTANNLNRKAVINGNSRFNEAYNVFRLCDKYGAGTRAFLMIGNPDETVADIMELLRQLKKLLPDEIRIGITTPLPGSEFYDQFQSKRLLLYTKYPEDWRRYTTKELVYRHSNLKSTQIRYLGNWLFDSYYSSLAYANHVEDKLKQHPQLQNGYKWFIRWLKNQHHLNIKLTDTTYKLHLCPAS